MTDIGKKIDHAVASGELDSKVGKLLHIFLGGYLEVLKKYPMAGYNPEKLLETYLQFVIKEAKDPTQFEPFHQRVRQPVDLCQLGLDFVKPLICFDQSTLEEHASLADMQKFLESGGNAILFANHQTEADPQIIYLMLEKAFPKLAEQMIFMAGDRVVRDPLAIPFSLGCNLLCIYSKRYIDHPPEMREQKLSHNQKTIARMSELLASGGQLIYVAPSGGRDRFDPEKNQVPVTAFDPQSIELFYLLSKACGKPTHFYPLALSTYNLLPPPQNIEKELGESRHAAHCPVHLHFGNPIDMESFPGSEDPNKKERRVKRAAYITHLVETAYNQFPVSKFC